MGPDYWWEGGDVVRGYTSFMAPFSFFFSVLLLGFACCRVSAFISFFPQD